MTNDVPSDSERCAWYALLVAIVRGCTVDAALVAMAGGWPAAFDRKGATVDEIVEAHRERDRKYRQRPDVKARHNEYTKARNKRLREQRKAEAQKGGGAG